MTANSTNLIDLAKHHTAATNRVSTLKIALERAAQEYNEALAEADRIASAMERLIHPIDHGPPRRIAAPQPALVAQARGPYRKTHSLIQRILATLRNGNPEGMTLKAIVTSMGEESRKSLIGYHLRQLTEREEVEQPSYGTYRLPARSSLEESTSATESV